MKKTVKIGWVFWVTVERYRTNYYRAVRCANSFEFVKFGFRVSWGMPWAKSFVEYHCLNSYGYQSEGIEKRNEEMLANKRGFKIRMPKMKYTIA